MECGVPPALKKLASEKVPRSTPEMKVNKLGFCSSGKKAIETWNKKSPHKRGVHSCRNSVDLFKETSAKSCDVMPATTTE